MASTDVRAVTTSAPLDPNTVSWASTSMPADEVQHGAHTIIERDRAAATFIRAR